MAQPDGARTGVTRGSISRCRKVRDSGQPEERITAIPKDRETGQPVDRPVGTAEGCELRGNSKIDRRQSRRCRRKGQPWGLYQRRGKRPEEPGRLGESGIWKRGRMRNSGQLEDPSPAQPKDEDTGQPEDSSPGAAKGCGVRGNPETQN